MTILPDSTITQETQLSTNEKAGNILIEDNLVEIPEFNATQTDLKNESLLIDENDIEVNEILDENEAITLMSATENIRI